MKRGRNSYLRMISRESGESFDVDETLEVNIHMMLTTRIGDRKYCRQKRTEIVKLALLDMFVHLI